MRQELCEGLHLMQDVWGTVIGDSHHQGVAHLAVRFFLAKGKDGGARRVGDGVRVAEVFLSVSQGMKWKKVQRAMWHEDQMLGLEVLSDGSHKFCVERRQVPLSRGEQRLLKTVRIRGPHAKFRKLKAQQVQKMEDPGNHADRGDFDRFSRNHSGDQTIPRRVIFDQRCA